MSNEEQKFNQAGVPIISLMFFMASLLVLVTLCRNSTPRIALSGKMANAVKLLSLLCVLQSLAAIFLIFSQAQLLGTFLLHLPLLGVYGFYTVDPVMMVLHAALVFYYLPAVQGLPDTLFSSNCQRFGHNDFCKEKWRTFLMFVTVVLHYTYIVVGFADMYFFSAAHLGVMKSADREPLMAASGAGGGAAAAGNPEAAGGGDGSNKAGGGYQSI